MVVLGWGFDMANNAGENWECLNEEGCLNKEGCLSAGLLAVVFEVEIY